MTDEMFRKALSRISSGDTEGLHEIYNEYLPMIFHTMCSYSRCREDAEDLTSDFFLKLCGLAGSYRPGNGHRAWLITIARNLAKDYLRKQNREISLTDYTGASDTGGSTSDIDIPGPAENGENAFSPVESAVVSSLTLEEALEKLTPAEREILSMHIVGELRFQEIAKVLEKPLSTVTSCYYSAINRLRRLGYE